MMQTAMKEQKYIQCDVKPVEIEVFRPGSKLEIEIKALFDLYFDASLLEPTAHYGLEFAISCGQGEHDLALYDKTLLLSAPSPWIVNKGSDKEKSIQKVWWFISGGKQLRKNETLTLTLDHMVTNNTIGDANIMVSVFALLPIGEETFQTIGEDCELIVSKTHKPVILDFAAKNVNKIIQADGFTDLDLLSSLSKIPVDIMPYATPEPPSPPPPTKTIIVNWRTQNAKKLVLSEGGELSGDEGTKEVKVPKSLTKIKLTAYSEKKVFYDKMIVDIN